MKNHVRIALRARKLTGCEDWPCEMLCGRIVTFPDYVQVHHIEHRGMGGNPSKDTEENLAILCVECHEMAEKRTDDVGLKQTLKNNVKAILEIIK